MAQLASVHARMMVARKASVRRRRLIRRRVALMLHRHLETVCRLITAPMVTDAGCVSLLLCFSSFPTRDLVCVL